MGQGIVVDFEGEISGIRQDIKRINESFNSFDREVRRTSSNVNKSFTDMERAASRVKTVALSFAGGLGFAAITRDVINTNRSMEGLRAQLKAIEGNSESAQRTFKLISDFAVNTPFEIDGLTETYIKLQNFGIKPTEQVLLSLTNQAAKLGGSQETLSGITLALGQAYAKGKLQAEEMNQLIERGVPIFQILADVTGQSGEALQDMAKNGELTADVIEKVIARMGELAKGSNAEAMKTLNGEISNFGDAWTRLQDAFLNDKSEGFIKRAVSGATFALNEITAQIDNSLDSQIKNAQNRLRELETFRAQAVPGSLVIPNVDKAIQEQYKLVQALREQQRLQDVNAKSAEAVKQTWVWVDETERKTAAIAGNVEKIGKKSKEIDLDRILAGLRFVETGSLGYNSKATSTTGARGTYQITRGFEKEAEKLLGKDIDVRNDKQAEEAVKVMVANLIKKYDGNIAKAVLAYSGVGPAGVDKAVAQGGEDFLKFAKMQRPEANLSPTEYLRRFNKGYDLSGDKTGINALNSFLSEQEKLADEAEKQAERIKNTYAGLQQEIANNRLPDLQRRIAEETQSALQQSGLDTNNLTAAQAKQREEIEKLIQQKYFDLEVTKLQNMQSEKQVEAFKEVQKATADLKQLLSDAVDGDTFNQQLARWRDLLKDGKISTEEFTAAMENLSIAFNKTPADIQKAGDEMSEFARQAARNIQDDFVEFLVDPFGKDLDTMADSFAKTLQRMVANAAAAQIFDALGIEKILKGGLSGGNLLSGVSGLFGGSSAPAPANTGGVNMGGLFDSIGGAFTDFFSNIPFFEQGTSYVPQDTLAFLHKGERVVRAADNRPGALATASGTVGGMVIKFTQNIHAGQGADPRQIKQAAGSGARDALNAFSSAQRYR